MSLYTVLTQHVTIWTGMTVMLKSYAIANPDQQSFNPRYRRDYCRETHVIMPSSIFDTSAFIPSIAEADHSEHHDLILYTL